MDSKGGGKIATSFQPHHHHHHHRHGHSHHHHHHHLFYISPHCPIHRSIVQPNNHSPSCSFPSSYPAPQNPEPVAFIQPDPSSTYLDAQPHEAIDGSEILLDDIEKLETEEEEEPIFVLTDEWRDFFAKSEAKRRLAKQQAKKRKN